MTSIAKKIPEADELKFADELMPGTTLLHGQFVIEKFLNSGGFGITYLARDSLKRRVVIKECFPSAFCRRSNTAVGARSRAHQVEFRSIVQLFMQEAFNLAKLKHPNIVGVHQVFEDNDTAYMAMDFVEGYDLQETLESTAEPLSHDQIRSVLDKILDAVAFIHSQDVLHRDISPDNILIDQKTGSPVLIDFGAAREEVSKASRALSEMRVVKDGYSPQEFYINGSLQGPSSDLYALAATFYHLITRNEPPNAQARLSAIASQEPDPYVPMRGKVAGYSEAFLAAIDKAMNVFPKDRLQSASEWIAMIDKNSTAQLAPVTRVKSRLLSAPFSSTETKVGSPAKSKSRTALFGSCAAVIAVLFGLAATQTDIFSGEAGNQGVEPRIVATVPTADTKRSTLPSDENPVAASAVPAAEPKVAAAVEISTAAKTDPKPSITPSDEKPVVRPVVPVGAPAAKPSVSVAKAGQVDPQPSDTLSGEKPVVDATPIVQPKIASAKAETTSPIGLLTTSTDNSATKTAVAPLAEPALQDTAPAEPVVQSAAETDVAAKAEAVVVPNNLARVEAMLTHFHTVKLPFAGTSDASNVIAALTNAAPDWMQPGQRITTVNGVAIKADDDLATVIGTTNDFSGLTDTKVTFEIEAFAGADLIKRDHSLPVVEVLKLANGVWFEISASANGPVAAVTAAPDGTDGSRLKVGDILVANMADASLFGAENPLLEVLTREIAREAEILNVAVLRDGAQFMASFSLAPTVVSPN